uniref:Peptidase M12A domain-containing protein n=1 Tax=Haemonchus contortus TaxID=6289 RepID=A0A7I4YA27_HAECO|nr:Peptidase M12A domain containing protein [Haemonchus contortus]
MLDFLLSLAGFLLVVVQSKTFRNDSVLNIPGMEMMASDKYPHYTVIESVSRTKWHRHRREVIAGPIYDWNSYEIPYQIWGGDYNFQNLIRRGIRMWEEATCLRFRENMASRDAIRYVLEKGDSCFTEYIGRNGGHQDIIIGSECAEGKSA